MTWGNIRSWRGDIKKKMKLREPILNSPHFLIIEEITSVEGGNGGLLNPCLE